MDVKTLSFNEKMAIKNDIRYVYEKLGEADNATDQRIKNGSIMIALSSLTNIVSKLCRELDIEVYDEDK